MGRLYPVQYEEPNCDKNEETGELEKSCHGAEGAVVRGRLFGKSDWGTHAR